METSDLYQNFSKKQCLYPTPSHKFHQPPSNPGHDLAVPYANIIEIQEPACETQRTPEYILKCPSSADYYSDS